MSTYQLFNLPRAQPFGSGVFLPNAYLRFYLTGTTTSTPVYTTSALSVAHTQPIQADAAGTFPEIYLDPSIQYKATLSNSADVLQYTVDPVNDNLLSAAIIGAVLYPRTTAETSAGVTPTYYYYEPYDFRRYGAVDDGSTDNTTLITGLFASFASAAVEFYAAPNVAFTFNTVAAAIPDRCVLRDDSMINGWNTAGFRQKVAGIVEGDDSTAVNDFQNIISSGHNAALILDNRGTASSSSGQNGIAMIMWGRGRFTKQAGQTGIRGVARTEFSKLDSTRWFWVLRRMVPWDARDYELWYTGKTYAAGSYIINGSVVYTTVAGGTAGASQPVHTTGSASDGGITWDVVLPNIDSAVFSVDQHGQIATNTSPTAAVGFYSKADQYSSGGGQNNWYLEADGISQTVRLRFRPTGGAGTVSAQPSILAQDGVGTRFMKSDFTDEYFRLDDTNGFTWQWNPAVKQATVTYSASMTPNAQTGESQTITATNGTAFTINAPTNAVTGRRLTLKLRNTSGGAMGAATWNAVFKMSAWTNPANGFSRSISFEYDGTNWVQYAQTGVDVPN